MNRVIKAQLALEEARKEMGGLLDLEERADDWTDKVGASKARILAAQSELEAAALLEPEPHEKRETTTPEDRELRSLHGKASVGRMVNDLFHNRGIDGVERELQDHYGIEGDQIPLALLEQRAAATITGDEPSRTESVIGQVFPQAVARWAGVSIEMAEAGQKQYPVLTTGLSVTAPAKAATAAETTGAFNVVTLTPGRLQGAFRYSREDAAVFDYLDMSLRSNMQEALTDALDNQVLNRAGANKGLLTFGTAPAKNGANVTNLTHALDAIYSNVDGKYASQANEIKLLLPNGAYSDLGKAIFAASDSVLALEKLGQICGGVRTSSNMPAKDATNGDEALVVVGMPRRNAVAVTWPGVTLTLDPYSAADTGEIILTALVQHDLAILRTDGYKRIRFK